MTEKRFWSEDYGTGYYTEVVDNEKELEDVPNPKKNLLIEEVIDLLNELAEENKLHKERIALLSLLLDLADAIIDTSDNEKAKEIWENKNEQTEKKWERILND